MKFSQALLSGALFAALLTTASAQPSYLNYQGRLTDNNGQPLSSSGTNILEFNIYNAATAGTLIWGPFLCDGTAGPGHAAKTIVSSGRFNVILGPSDTTSRSITNVFTNDIVYLEIRANNGTPIQPRQQFLTAPYAFEATHADRSSTVSDPNVAYRTVANVFTAPNRFDGAVIATNSSHQFGGSFIGTAFVPYFKFVELSSGSTVAGTNNWRNFNAKLFDTFNLGAVGSGIISLPAGTYQCHVSVPAFRIETHQARLRTSAGTTLYGTVGFSDASTEGSQDRSEIVGQFTLDTPGTVRVQHFCTLARANDGLGSALQAITWGDGGSQTVFAVAEFWKIK